MLPVQKSSRFHDPTTIFNLCLAHAPHSNCMRSTADVSHVIHWCRLGTQRRNSTGTPRARQVLLVLANKKICAEDSSPSINISIFVPLASSHSIGASCPNTHSSVSRSRNTLRCSGCGEPEPRVRLLFVSHTLAQRVISAGLSSYRPRSRLLDIDISTCRLHYAFCTA